MHSSWVHFIQKKNTSYVKCNNSLCLWNNFFFADVTKALWARKYNIIQLDFLHFLKEMWVVLVCAKVTAMIIGVAKRLCPGLKSLIFWSLDMTLFQTKCITFFCWHHHLSDKNHKKVIFSATSRVVHIQFERFLHYHKLAIKTSLKLKKKNLLIFFFLLFV